MDASRPRWREGSYCYAGYQKDQNLHSHHAAVVLRSNRDNNVCQGGADRARDGWNVKDREGPCQRVKQLLCTVRVRVRKIKKVDKRPGGNTIQPLLPAMLILVALDSNGTPEDGGSSE